jgi:hypothetical protein
VVALMNMLKAAGDDDTRREAVKALAMLAPYGKSDSDSLRGDHHTEY